MALRRGGDDGSTTTIILAVALGVVLIILFVVLFMRGRRRHRYYDDDDKEDFNSVMMSDSQRRNRNNMMSDSQKRNNEHFDNSYTTINYYFIPGCPYCVQFDDTWNTVQQQMPNVQFKKLDLSTNQYPHISSAPTIVLSKNGQEYQYSGNRTPQDFKSFIESYIN